MKRYRIVEHKNLFYVQRRVAWFWVFECAEANGTEIAMDFSHIEDAREYVKWVKHGPTFRVVEYV